MLIERMKESREYLRESLLLYERRLTAQWAEVETKKKLYERDLISKLELENSQRAMPNMQLDAERIRHLIAEDDVALSLAEENAPPRSARCADERRAITRKLRPSFGTTA